MALTDGLVSAYNCDESGSFPDLIGSNDGTRNGSVYTSSGKIDGGESFDGINDYVDSNLILSPSDNWTISLWFYSISGNNTYILDNYNGVVDNFIRIYFVSGDLKINTGTGSSYLQYTNTTTNYIDSSRHHLVVTRDGTNNLLKTYIDGVEKSSLTDSRTGTDFANASFKLGRNGSALQNYLNGKLDMIYIYNRAITSTEVTELYNAGAGIQYPFIIALGNALMFGFNF